MLFSVVVLASDEYSRHTPLLILYIHYITWFIILNGLPADWKATRRARGVRPCLATASSVATMRAPAPSLIPEALAAVTVPSFLNKDLSFCILSIVASGLLEGGGRLGTRGSAAGTGGGSDGRSSAGGGAGSGAGGGAGGGAGRRAGR